MQLDVNVSAKTCPLCGNENYCGNLVSGSDGGGCWCTSSDIAFPDSLLNQVPNDAKNKACICKSCALKHKRKIDGS
ncbi:cysteine-rich CWC family protein [Arenicella xantha]|uniref:cysteine-rich CWC family protein n=1 Tax=Arenicella xantha TaxID=644221 RepID=UPI000DE86EBB